MQFANDEGDPGMGLELGLDAFCHGGDRLHSATRHLLAVGYDLVNREAFAKTAAAFLSEDGGRRSKDGPCKMID